jgi:hypothetical protein
MDCQSITLVSQDSNTLVEVAFDYLRLPSDVIADRLKGSTLITFI